MIHAFHEYCALRPGVAFVVAVVDLLQQMQRHAGGGPFVDAHTANSARAESAFAWHVDDHAAAEGGCYIERSVVCLCSPGEGSICFAGAGAEGEMEVDYSGVGSMVCFPAWFVHRTGRVAPRGSSLWKFAAFFGK